MKRFLICLLSLFSIFMFTYSNPDGFVLKLTKEQMSKTKGTYCGPNLANTLSMLCKGSYNTRLPVKKSCKHTYWLPVKYFVILFVDNADYNDVYPQSQFDDGEEVFEYPFIPKEISNSIFPNRLRKRGIIEECCLKSCSIWELYTYCR